MTSDSLQDLRRWSTSAGCVGILIALFLPLVVAFFWDENPRFSWTRYCFNFLTISILLFYDEFREQEDFQNDENTVTPLLLAAGFLAESFVIKLDPQTQHL